MKRKIFLLSVVAICIAIAAVGTLAYFNAEDTAHNDLRQRQNPPG